MAKRKRVVKRRRKTAYCVIEKSKRGSLSFHCGISTKAAAAKKARAIKRSKPTSMARVTKDVAR